jgi:hypothetical protein
MNGDERESAGSGSVHDWQHSRQKLDLKKLFCEPRKKDETDQTSQIDTCKKTRPFAHRPQQSVSPRDGNLGPGSSHQAGIRPDGP